MRFLKTKSGYAFYNRFVSLTKLGDSYAIQTRGPFTFTFYCSTEKPRFRNLGAYSVLCVAIYACLAVPILLLFIWFATSLLLHWVGKFLQKLSKLMGIDFD